MAADILQPSTHLHLSRRSASLAALMGPLLVAEVLAGAPAPAIADDETPATGATESPIRKVGKARYSFLSMQIRLSSSFNTSLIVELRHHRYDQVSEMAFSLRCSNTAMSWGGTDH